MFGSSFKNNSKGKPLATPLSKIKKMKKIKLSKVAYGNKEYKTCKSQRLGLIKFLWKELDVKHEQVKSLSLADNLLIICSLISEKTIGVST